MSDNIKLYADYVKRNKNLIYDAVNYIWQHPEIGFKEWKTSKYLAEQFESLGYEVIKAGDIPGFIAELDTGREGATIGVIGELDALCCETHPDADKETKAVHACGHHVQTSAMLGVAAALKEKGAVDELSGKIRFIAVPAEETIDLEYRNSLIEKGIIKYVAGKIEFIRRGFFDGVDMAIMIHLDNLEEYNCESGNEYLFKFIDGSDGCITKHFEYEGVAAHAGGAPHKGRNALYAASLGLSACNALRETFKEKDYVRYHPIITNGGVAANAIPDLVKMDTYVRAATLKVIKETNKKINRAIGSTAAALGCNVMVSDKPGNLPLHNSSGLNKCCKEVIEEIFGENMVYNYGWDTQSSDIGDVSGLMPVMQNLCDGATGNQHGDNYFVADKKKAVLNPTIVMTCMIYMLLKNNSARANKIKNEYKPLFKSKEEYFEEIDKIEMSRELVEYEGDSVVKINFCE